VPVLAAMRKKWRCYAFLIPVFIPLIVFGYLPAIEAFKLSFTDSAGAFVGLQHIRDMFADRKLIRSVSVMLKLLVAGMLTANIPALLMAELLYNLRSKRASANYRFLFIIPMMIPTLVIYLVWQFMIFESSYGLANALLKALGMKPLGWLNDSSTAIISLVLIGFPWISGTNLLIYLAGLQSIPQSVLESCQLDGANFWQRFVKIDLPLLVGQLKLLLILGIINGMQAFQLQLMTTQGGPRNATMVPGLWMYRQAFVFSNFNYASAIGLSMFLVVLVLTIISNWLINTDVSQ
jgi:raffinose/stachyose/melibiose transport system permease protein